MTLASIRKLSDTEVISGLDTLSRRRRAISAEIVAHLVIINERNIHLEMRYSSLVGYCVGRLGCSRAVAYKWTAAVKVARAHPHVLCWLADGEITTSALTALAPHSGDVDLVARSRGKSRRQIRLMCAAKYPRKDWNRIQFRVRPIVEGLSKLEMTVPNGLLEQIGAALDLDSDLDPRRDPVALLSRALATYIDTRRQPRQRATDGPRSPQAEATAAVPGDAVCHACEPSDAPCEHVAAESRRDTAGPAREPDPIGPRARHRLNDIPAAGGDHARRAADEPISKRRQKAARRRSEVARYLASTLEQQGLSRRAARRAATGAVAALGHRAPLDLLVKEALRRASRFRASRPAEAKPRRDRRGSRGSRERLRPNPRGSDSRRG